MPYIFISFFFFFFPPIHFRFALGPIRYVANWSSPGEILEQVTFELDLENRAVGGGRGKKEAYSSAGGKVERWSPSASVMGRCEGRGWRVRCWEGVDREGTGC